MGQLTATIKTNKGDIRINLFPDKAPVTVASFVNLAKRGYYNGLTFHRVIADFMIQGGCPRGTGTGGPGYTFEDECTPALKHDKPGMLSMANAGPGTNGSQFFITHVPTPWLDGKHTIFGAVVDATDQKTVNSIAQKDRIDSITINGDTADLFAKMADRIEQWNAALDRQAGTAGLNNMGDRIVYSTESGDLRGTHEKEREPRAVKAKPAMPRDGIVRVMRESKGRGGKTVTAVYGLPLSGDRLDSLAAKLKQKCGAGGTVKDGIVIIQGDKVDTVIRLIQDEGFTVKKAGR